VLGCSLATLAAAYADLSQEHDVLLAQIPEGGGYAGADDDAADDDDEDQDEDQGRNSRRQLKKQRSRAISENVKEVWGGACLFSSLRDAAYVV